MSIPSTYIVSIKLAFFVQTGGNNIEKWETDLEEIGRRRNETSGGSSFIIFARFDKQIGVHKADTGLGV